MNSKDLIKRKKDLDIELQHAISGVLRSFKEDTGLYPNHISVAMQEISSIGNETEYVLTQVKSQVCL